MCDLVFRLTYIKLDNTVATTQFVFCVNVALSCVNSVLIPFSICHLIIQPRIIEVFAYKTPSALRRLTPHRKKTPSIFENEFSSSAPPSKRLQAVRVPPIVWTLSSTVNLTFATNKPKTTPTAPNQPLCYPENFILSPENPTSKPTILLHQSSCECRFSRRHFACSQKSPSYIQILPSIRN